MKSLWRSFLRYQHSPLEKIDRLVAETDASSDWHKVPNFPRFLAPHPHKVCWTPGIFLTSPFLSHLRLLWHSTKGLPSPTAHSMEPRKRNSITCLLSSSLYCMTEDSELYIVFYQCYNEVQGYGFLNRDFSFPLSLSVPTWRGWPSTGGCR